MSLVTVRATYDCDGCGKQFRVEMDPSAMRPKGMSLFDEAEDYLRGGCGTEGMPAVVHDMHLCHDCARIAALVGPDGGGYAPKPQIVAAIEKAARKAERGSRVPTPADPR